jgi:hypothetical protein
VLEREVPGPFLRLPVIHAQVLDDFIGPFAQLARQPEGQQARRLG